MEEKLYKLEKKLKLFEEDRKNLSSEILELREENVKLKLKMHGLDTELYENKETTWIKLNENDKDEPINWSHHIKNTIALRICSDRKGNVAILEHDINLKKAKIIFGAVKEKNLYFNNPKPILLDIEIFEGMKIDFCIFASHIAIVYINRDKEIHLSVGKYKLDINNNNCNYQIVWKSSRLLSKLADDVKICSNQKGQSVIIYSLNNCLLSISADLHNLNNPLFTDAHYFDYGTQFDVEIDDNGLVFEIHSSKKTDLWYNVGQIEEITFKINWKQKSKLTTLWGKKKKKKNFLILQKKNRLWLL